MSTWLYEIRDLNGENPVRLTTVTKRKGVLALSKPGQVTFSLDLNSTEAAPANLAESRSQVWVYRDGVLKFSGVIMVVERYFDENTQYAAVTALGWLWFFGKRVWASTSDDVHDNEDAGAILLYILMNTQIPEFYQDLGITEGEIETSQDIDITLSRIKAKDAFDSVALASNIEYEISPLKRLNVYYPHKGTDRSDEVKFKYPGNIKNIRIISDATEIVNFSRAFGNGLGELELRSVEEDVESEEVYGAYEEYLSRKDIKRQSELDDVLANFVAERRNSRVTVDVTVDGNDQNVDLNDYNVGDSVRIIVEHTNYSYSQIFRVFEIHFDIDEKDVESNRLILALV